MLHNLDLKKQEKKPKHLIIGVGVNVGAEVAIFQYLVKKLKKLHPSEEFDAEYFLYIGEKLEKDIKKTKKTKNPDERVQKQFKDSKDTLNSLKVKFKNDPEGLKQALSKKMPNGHGVYSINMLKAMAFSSRDIEEIRYSHSETNLVRSLNVKGSMHDLPYHELSKIPAHIAYINNKLRNRDEELLDEAKKSIYSDDELLDEHGKLRYEKVTVVCTSQSAGCGYHSLKNSLNTKSKKKQEQAAEESILHQEFLKGLEWLKKDSIKHPNVSIISFFENVPGVQRADIAKDITAALSEIELEVFEGILPFRMVSGEQRIRDVFVAIRQADKKNSPLVPDSIKNAANGDIKENISKGSDDNNPYTDEEIFSQLFPSEERGVYKPLPNRFLKAIGYKPRTFGSLFSIPKGKYADIREEEQLIEIIQAARGKVEENEKGKFCQNPVEFSALAKLFLSLKYKLEDSQKQKELKSKHKDSQKQKKPKSKSEGSQKQKKEYFVIMEPSTCNAFFLKKNGEERDLASLQEGIMLDLNLENGLISAKFSNKGELQSNTRIEMRHSEFKLRTLLSDVYPIFWNLSGHTPSVSELALMLGYPKELVLKLIEIETGLTLTAQRELLLHNLPPLVFIRLALGLVQEIVFGIKPKPLDILPKTLVEEKLLEDLKRDANESKPQAVSEKMIVEDELLEDSKEESNEAKSSKPVEKKLTVKEKLLKDLNEGFNLDDYELCKVNLLKKKDEVSKKYVYAVKNKNTGDVIPGIFISKLSLLELQKRKFFDVNGKLKLAANKLAFSSNVMDGIIFQNEASYNNVIHGIRRMAVQEEQPSAVQEEQPSAVQEEQSSAVQEEQSSAVQEEQSSAVRQYSMKDEMEDLSISDVQTNIIQIEKDRMEIDKTYSGKRIHEFFAPSSTPVPKWQKLDNNEVQEATWTLKK